MNLNFNNVNTAIELLYKKLPYGDFFSEIVESLNIDYIEKDSLEKFLLDNDIMIDCFGLNDGRYILTDKGQEVYTLHGSIEKYFEYIELQNNERLRLERIKNKKLEFDSKLSKWQVITFWPIFTFGFFGFILGVLNYIDSEKKSRTIEELQQKNIQIQEQVTKLNTAIYYKYKHSSIK